MKKTKTFVSLALIIAMLFCIIPFSVNADDSGMLNSTPIPEGIYFIRNRQYTGKYLQIDNDDGPNYTTDGQHMEIWGFDGGNYQKWYIKRRTDGYYEISSLQSGLYLSVQQNYENTADKELIQTAYSANNSRQLWSISYTSHNGFVFRPKSGEGGSKDWCMCVGDYLFPVYDGRNVEQRKYVNNTSYKDEWDIISVFPTSGNEITYNTNLWNYSPVQASTNCYAYSLNNQVIPNTNYLWYMQPGQAAGYELTSNMITAMTVKSFVEADAEVLGFTFSPISKYDVCTGNTYKVALVVANGVDYHWYRENPDKTWSHKPGRTAVTKLDASSHVIYDPEVANRNYQYANYSTFVGYFAVTPLNNMYSGSQQSVGLPDHFQQIEFSTKSTSPIQKANSVNISKGMTYSAITEEIGLPQRMLTFGLMVVEYDLSDTSIVVEYAYNMELQDYIE